MSLSTSVNAPSTLESQLQQLQEELARKKEQVDRLDSVKSDLTYAAGEMNQAALEAQEYLQKDTFQKALPNPLQPHQTVHPLQQMKALMEMARQVKTGMANQKLEKGIEELNKTVGQTNALSINLEEKVSQTEDLILKMRALIAERKKNLQQTKEITKEIK